MVSIMFLAYVRALLIVYQLRFRALFGILLALFSRHALDGAPALLDPTLEKKTVPLSLTSRSSCQIIRSKCGQYKFFQYAASSKER